MVIAAIFIGGSKDSYKSHVVAETFGDIVQRIDDFYLIRVSDSKLEWEVGARNASISSGEEEAVLQDINIIHRTQTGSVITLTADTGRYNIGSNSFFMEKGERDVNIRIAEDMTIYAGNLIWSDIDRQVRSSGKVHVTGQTFILEGEDLVADLDSGVYEISKNIRAKMWQ